MFNIKKRTMEQFKEMYDKVLGQLNEKLDTDLFDVGDLNVIHQQVGDLENPTFTFKRYNYQGQRLYVKMPLQKLPDGTFELKNTVLDWGVGVTGIISKNERGEDKAGLQKWLVDMRNKGKDTDKYLKERADFGTIFHLLADYLLKGVVFNKDGFKNQVLKIVSKENLLTKYRTSEILDSYDTHLYNALIGFSNWCSEVNLKPIATELVVHNKNYGVASPIDILAEITLEEEVKLPAPSGEYYKKDCKNGKKGDPKMVDRTFTIPKTKTVIVDLKTSTNSYKSHLFQLMFCKDMLKETYNIEVDEIINWHPKEDMSTKGVVKIWNPNYFDIKSFEIMKESCKVSLLKSFEKGIKIINEYKTPKTVAIVPKIFEYDYEIKGDKIILEDGTELEIPTK